MIASTMKISAVFMMCLMGQTLYGQEQNKVAQHLQDISVTIRAGFSEGSGVLISREVPVSKGSDETITVNFVVTCAHVVDGLRSTRQVINNGSKETMVEFKDAQIIKELVENGRKVGEFKMDAKVILYSDATEGEDLAVLMVRKQSFLDKNTEFYLENEPVAIGTDLYHVGSLLGQSGANSMTKGIMSQIGRVLNIGSAEGVVFDQTTVTAFPGSSGGGVFLTDGQYVGMLVRGSGETFNFIVPVRRMEDWVSDRDVQWVLDPSQPVPHMDALLSMQPEDECIDSSSDAHKNIEFPYLIRNIDE